MHFSFVTDNKGLSVASIDLFSHLHIMTSNINIVKLKHTKQCLWQQLHYALQIIMLPQLINVLQLSMIYKLLETDKKLQQPVTSRGLYSIGLFGTTLFQLLAGITLLLFKMYSLLFLCQEMLSQAFPALPLHAYLPVSWVIVELRFSWMAFSLSSIVYLPCYLGSYVYFYSL